MKVLQDIDCSLDQLKKQLDEIEQQLSDILVCKIPSIWNGLTYTCTDEIEIMK